MRIDSHHHLWDLRVRDQDWIVGPALAPIKKNFLLKDLEETLTGTGIEKTIVVQTVTDYAETPELLSLAAEKNCIAGVCGWLKIEAPDAIEHLEKYLSHPAAGYLKSIRDIAQDQPDSAMLAKPQTIANVRELGERNIAFEILTKTPELPAAIALVKAAPDTQFILNHISKPYIAKGEMQPWKDLIAEIAAHPNVVCKISGLVTEAQWDNWTSPVFTPYIDHVLEIFTPQRLAFGSDWPVALLAASYNEVVSLAEALTAQLSPDEAKRFWFGTANEVYRLNLS